MLKKYFENQPPRAQLWKIFLYYFHFLKPCASQLWKLLQIRPKISIDPQFLTMMVY